MATTFPAPLHPLDLPLSQALASKNLAAFSALFNQARAGLGPNARGAFPASLAAALRSGNQDAMTLLAAISDQASLDHALESADQPAHTPLACRLLRSGADPKRARLLGMNFEHYDEGIRDLLAAGAHPDAGGALLTACSHGRLESVKRLLAAGANPNALDEDGLSPLSLCLRYEISPSRFRFLGLDERGLHLLHHGQDIAHALLEAGADASIPQPRALPGGGVEPPPLAAAIRAGNQPLITALIDQGAPADWLFDSPESNRTMAPFLLYFNKHLAKDASISRAMALAKGLCIERQRAQASASAPSSAPLPPAAAAEPGSPPPSEAPSPLHHADPQDPPPPRPAPALPYGLASAHGPALPLALADDSPEAIERALAETDRAERHIALLRSQAGVLSLARTLSEFPAITSFELRRLYCRDDPENPEDYYFIATNRGLSPQGVDAAKSSANLRAFPREASLPIAIDPGSGSPEDQRAMEALELWIQSQPEDSLRRLFSRSKTLQSPPPGSSEPLAHALMRQALSPQELALWEAVCLARAAEPAPPPALPDLSRLAEARARRILGSSKTPSL